MNYPRHGLRRLVLPLACAVCGLCSATAEAQSLFFRPETGGAAPATGGTYTWNDALTNWYTASSGGSDTTWTTGSTAVFPVSTGAGSYTVTLGSDVTVGGVTMNSGFAASNGVTISAASTQTITFASGAVVAPNSGSGRAIIFGANTALSGNFAIISNNSNTADVVIGGNVYSGTVTIQRGRLLLANQTSTANTKVVMNSGSAGLGFQTTGSGTGTIAQLSGSAGSLNRGSGPGFTIVVDQATDTTFGGVLEETAWTFRKAGVGTLVLNGTGSHSNRPMAVDAGRLFVRGDSTSGASSANTLTVAAGATYGGVGSLGTKIVTLSAETSRLAPGMYDIDADEQLVGLLPLGAGTHVFNNGGTFDFAVQAVSGSLSTSKMSLAAGGVLTLGTGKTFHINLIDVGLAGLEPGPHALTLFSAASAPANYATFESQWQLNTATLPSGWALADPGNAFEIVGNDIVMNVIIPVPEPATILMCLPLPAYLLWRCRRRK